MRKLVLGANKLSRNTQLGLSQTFPSWLWTTITISFGGYISHPPPMCYFSSSLSHLLLQSAVAPCPIQRRLTVPFLPPQGLPDATAWGEPLSIHTCVTKILLANHRCESVSSPFAHDINTFYKGFQKASKISTSCRHPELLPPLPWFHSCCPSFRFPGTTSQINNLCARLCLGLCFWWHWG